ncbi:helix-turn-helix domain-containing protein [Cryptosporangium aurantiacum]
MSATPTRPVGQLVREWRERRRLSQLDLSSRSGISTRHLSFVETGRSRPTPEMLMKLSDFLDVPLRERNQLLLAGGYAPRFPEYGLDAPELESVRAALRLVLAGHEPHPAVLVNRWWEMLEANAAVPVLTVGCAPHLLEPPINVLRLSLHPEGLAPRILNLAQWRAHLLGQLRRRVDQFGDARLAALYDELAGYPGGLDHHVDPTSVVLPMRLRHDVGELSFFSIAATVETAADVTVDELVLESFFPADPQTAERLRSLL